MSKKENRTKGNTQTASAARAQAQLAAGGGFATFTSIQHAFTTAPVALTDDPQSPLSPSTATSLNPAFALSYAKLSKVDPVTKLKGLKEIEQTVQDGASAQDLEAFLPFWARIYSKIASDPDKRVRETTQAVHGLLCSKMGRAVVPHLKVLVPEWLSSTFDTSRDVSRAASAAFALCFTTDEKRTNAAKFCKVPICEHVVRNLQDVKLELPSAERICLTSLSLLTKLVHESIIIAEDMSHLLSIMTLPSFWKIGSHNSPYCRLALFHLLQELAENLPAVYDERNAANARVSGFVDILAQACVSLLSGIADSDNNVCTAAFSALIAVLQVRPALWNADSKAASSALAHVLSVVEAGCHNGATAQALSQFSLALLSVLPAGSDTWRFEYLSALQSGVLALSSKSSTVKLLMVAYIDCSRYLIHHASASLEEKLAQQQPAFLRALLHATFVSLETCNSLFESWVQFAVWIVAKSTHIAESLAARFVNVVDETSRTFAVESAESVEAKGLVTSLKSLVVQFELALHQDLSEKSMTWSVLLCSSVVRATSLSLQSSTCHAEQLASLLAAASRGKLKDTLAQANLSAQSLLDLLEKYSEVDTAVMVSVCSLLLDTLASMNDPDGRVAQRIVALLGHASAHRATLQCHFLETAVRQQRQLPEDLFSEIASLRWTPSAPSLPSPATYGLLAHLIASTPYVLSAVQAEEILTSFRKFLSFETLSTNLLLELLDFPILLCASIKTFGAHLPADLLEALCLLVGSLHRRWLTIVDASVSVSVFSCVKELLVMVLQNAVRTSTNSAVIQVAQLCGQNSAAHLRSELAESAMLLQLQSDQFAELSDVLITLESGRSFLKEYLFEAIDVGRFCQRTIETRASRTLCLPQLFSGRWITLEQVPTDWCRDAIEKPPPHIVQMSSTLQYFTLGSFHFLQHITPLQFLQIFCLQTWAEQWVERLKWQQFDQAGPELRNLQHVVVMVSEWVQLHRAAVHARLDEKFWELAVHQGLVNGGVYVLALRRLLMLSQLSILPKALLPTSPCSASAQEAYLQVLQVVAPLVFTEEMRMSLLAQVGTNELTASDSLVALRAFASREPHQLPHLLATLYPRIKDLPAFVMKARPASEAEAGYLVQRETAALIVDYFDHRPNDTEPDRILFYFILNNVTRWLDLVFKEHSERMYDIVLAAEALLVFGSLLESPMKVKDATAAWTTVLREWTPVLTNWFLLHAPKSFGAHSLSLSQEVLLTRVARIVSQIGESTVREVNETRPLLSDMLLMLSMPLSRVQNLAFHSALLLLSPPIDSNEAGESSKDDCVATLSSDDANPSAASVVPVVPPSLHADVVAAIKHLPSVPHELAMYERRALYYCWWLLLAGVQMDLRPLSRLGAATWLRDHKLDSVLLRTIYDEIIRDQTWTKADFWSQPSAADQINRAAKYAIVITEEHLHVESNQEAAESLTWLAACVYREFLGVFPLLSRLWFAELEHGLALQVDRFTAKYITPLIVSVEFARIRSQEGKVDGMEVRTNASQREVTAIYKIDESTAELVIRMSDSHPLHVVSIDGGRRIGVTENQWRRWLVQMVAFLSSQNGSVVDALQVWKRNADKRFEGIEECAICYSIIHSTNQSMPNLPCKTCKHKFHSICLYKWFNTGAAATCPLCRNVF